MNVNLRQNRQIRSIGLAFAASVFAAVATMFVPVSILENITGASGLSELVPATAAPLGDTARALIAFATGVLTLSLMAVILVRQNAGEAPQPAQARSLAESSDIEDRDPIAAFKNMLANVRLPKMPWAKDEDDITELSDLPKLRGGDSHPDAPPRRPLSATQDLPVFNLTERAPEPVTENPQAEVPLSEEFTSGDVTETAAEPKPFIAKSNMAEAGHESAPTDVLPTLADMIAQLEASVTQRQQQLAELETVAANLSASKVIEPVAAAGQEVPRPPIQSTEAKIPAEPARTTRPPLEAVPVAVPRQDDMDEALAAALATLHRMSSTGR